MGTINTIHGPLDEVTLARTLGFEDRPTMYVVWIEWKRGDELVRREAYPLPKETGDEVYTTKGMVARDSLVRTIELIDQPLEIVVAVVWHLAGEFVRRDAHVILKQPSVTADAVVGGF